MDQDDFDAGYSDIEQAQTTTPEPIETDPPEVTPEPPKYIQITESEWNDTRTRLTAIDEIKAENKRLFDAAFGKLGGMKEVVDRLQSQTPTGEAVEITDEDMKELQEEFGELAGPTKAVLQRVVAKIRGTGTAVKPEAAASTPGLTQAEFEAAREADREAIRTEFRLEKLTDLHPDWKQVRETPAFKAWRDGLPEAERTQFNTSQDPRYVAGMLTKFKKTLEKPASTNVSTRQKRIEAAVTPRGVGGHAPSKTDLDDFESGYAG